MWYVDIISSSLSKYSICMIQRQEWIFEVGATWKIQNIHSLGFLIWDPVTWLTMTPTFSWAGLRIMWQSFPNTGHYSFFCHRVLSPGPLSLLPCSTSWLASALHRKLCFELTSLPVRTRAIFPPLFNTLSWLNPHFSAASSDHQVPLFEQKSSFLERKGRGGGQSSIDHMDLNWTHFSCHLISLTQSASSLLGILAKQSLQL